jgi:frataxin-like iron-binding protein CyaY
MIALAKFLGRVQPHCNKILGVDATRRAQGRAMLACLGDNLPQRFSYHSTIPVGFPVRRRRRPANRHQNDSVDSEETSDHNPLKHSPVVDPVEFPRAAEELLTRIEKGLEPMKAQNETFILERSRSDLGEVITLDLGAKLGNYRIEISEEEHVFEYSSPISGKLLYVLSAATGEWVGQEDGHNFEGLLVRDLIRFCQGMPKL